MGTLNPSHSPIHNVRFERSEMNDDAQHISFVTYSEFKSCPYAGLHNEGESQNLIECYHRMQLLFTVSE